MTTINLISHIVVKVGGSLFRHRDLFDVAIRWISANIERSPVILCGGGQLADVVRLMDSELQLGDSLAHNLAIQTMRLNLSVLASRFANPSIVTSIDEIHSMTVGQGPILFDLDWWQLKANVGAHNWETTSDSIAAVLAIDTGASELVLLKSDAPTLDESVEFVFRSNLVDGSFASWANKIPAIRIVPIGNPKPEWLWINENHPLRSKTSRIGQ